MMESLQTLLEKHRSIYEARLVERSAEALQWKAKYASLRAEVFGDSAAQEEDAPEAGAPGRPAARPRWQKLHLFPHFRELKGLDLSSEALGDGGLGELMKSVRLLPKLSDLRLRSAGLTDACAGHLRELMRSVQHLDVSHNELGAACAGAVLEGLQGARGLRALRLEGNMDMSRTPRFGADLSKAITEAAQSESFKLRCLGVTLADFALVAGRSSAGAPAPRKARAGPRRPGLRPSRGGRKAAPGASRPSPQRPLQASAFARRCLRAGPKSPLRAVSLCYAKMSLEGVGALALQLWRLVELDLSFAYIGFQGTLALARALSAPVALHGPFQGPEARSMMRQRLLDRERLPAPEAPADADPPRAERSARVPPPRARKGPKAAKRRASTAAAPRPQRRSAGGGGAGPRRSAAEPKEAASLKRLELRGNAMGDGGAVALAAALIYNASLEFLGVASNDITRTGAEALQRVRGERAAALQVDLARNGAREAGYGPSDGGAGAPTGSAWSKCEGNELSTVTADGMDAIEESLRRAGAGPTEAELACSRFAKATWVAVATLTARQTLVNIAFDLCADDGSAARAPRIAYRLRRARALTGAAGAVVASGVLDLEARSGSEDLAASALERGLRIFAGEQLRLEVAITADTPTARVTKVRWRAHDLAQAEAGEAEPDAGAVLLEGDLQLISLGDYAGHWA